MPFVLKRIQLVSLPLAEVFDFFARAENLEALTPPFLKFGFVTPLPIEMREGTLIDYKLRLYGIPLRWRTRIDEWVPGVRFVDSQIAGPYRLWRHLHEFKAVPGGTEVRDRVDYALPFGNLGKAIHALFVRRLLGRIFDYREARMSMLRPLPGGTAERG